MPDLFAHGLELFVVNVGPDLLHIVEVCNDAVFHGIFESQEASEVLCLSTDEGVSFDGSGHGSGVLWAAYAGVEEGFG